MENIESSEPIPFQPFLREAVLKDGVMVLSAHRAFAHDESSYDTQYDHEAPDPGPGLRLIEILSKAGLKPGGAILELGCGTGLLSVGLAQSDFFKNVVITDGSMSFVNIAHRKLKVTSPKPSTYMALLQADDVGEIDPGRYDVIAMRSVLHHVNDFQAFLDVMIGKLSSGGFFCCMEPKAETFMWMGTVMALFPGLAAGSEIELDEAERASIKLFIDTMIFYLRRDMDKSGGEDKHAFWISELLEAAERNNCQMSFASESPAEDSVALLLSYLKYCMGFTKELVDKIELGLRDLRETVLLLTSGIPAPDSSGWFIFKKL